MGHRKYTVQNHQLLSLGIIFEAEILPQKYS